MTRSHHLYSALRPAEATQQASAMPARREA